MNSRWATRMSIAFMAVAITTIAVPATALGQESDWVDRELPNPTGEVLLNWAPLPDNREWGSTAGIDIGPDGHVWAYDRCGGLALAGGCEENSHLDPIFKFNKDTGDVMASFGAGLFVLPHGIHVDFDGNVWSADARGEGDKGHQVHKFSPEGELLMSLGTAGVAGDGSNEFNGPSDVLVAPNGDIFVVDGHGSGGNNRVVKFHSDGTFMKTWGQTGAEDGEFRDPHALAMDSQGRLFVGDRGNSRLQIFTQDGEHIATWTQFGRPSGLFIDVNDILYSADSESNATWGRNPGWKRGIRVGSAIDGFITAFIPDPEPDPDNAGTTAAEGVAVDAQGNVYGAEVGPRQLRKYVRR